MKQFSAAIVCTSFLVACSSTPEQHPSATSVSMRDAPARPDQPRAAAPQPRAAATAQSPANAGVGASARPAKNSVYFEYDSSAVKPEYAAVVSAHARFLANQRAPGIRVEGNADERGSREYNLALGERRAQAVKQSLTLLGVPAERIEAISYGEEKPRADDHTEAAYAENRRADILYANR